MQQTPATNQKLKCSSLQAVASHHNDVSEFSPSVIFILVLVLNLYGRGIFQICKNNAYGRFWKDWRVAVSSVRHHVSC